LLLVDITPPNRDFSSCFFRKPGERFELARLEAEHHKIAGKWEILWVNEEVRLNKLN
jgi:hypothetical protein